MRTLISESTSVLVTPYPYTPLPVAQPPLPTQPDLAAGSNDSRPGEDPAPLTSRSTLQPPALSLRLLGGLEVRLGRRVSRPRLERGTAMPVLCALALYREGLCSKELHKIIRGPLDEDDQNVMPDRRSERQPDPWEQSDYGIDSWVNGLGGPESGGEGSEGGEGGDHTGWLRGLIRRIRHSLGDAHDTLQLQRINGSFVYVLDQARVRCDIWDFQDLLEAADNYEQSADSLNIRAARTVVSGNHFLHRHDQRQDQDQEQHLRDMALSLRQEALMLYGGDLDSGMGALVLKGDFAERRDALRARYTRTLLQCANYWHHQALVWHKRAVGGHSLNGLSGTTETACWRKALGLYEQAIKADPLDEAPYAGAMICLAYLGAKKPLVSLYDSLVDLLRTEVEDQPASPTARIYKSCLRQLASGVPIPDPMPDWCKGIVTPEAAKGIDEA